MLNSTCSPVLSAIMGCASSKETGRTYSATQDLIEEKFASPPGMEEAVVDAAEEAAATAELEARLAALMMPGEAEQSSSTI